MKTPQAEAFKLRWLIPLYGLILYSLDKKSSGKELLGLLFLNSLLIPVSVGVLKGGI